MKKKNSSKTARAPRNSKPETFPRFLSSLPAREATALLEEPVLFPAPLDLPMPFEEEALCSQTLGSLLRGVRERQGVSQVAFSGRTRIPLHHVKALEEDSFEYLPAEVYVQGMVQKYRKYFGIDEEALKRVSQTLPKKEMSGRGDFLPTNRFASSRLKIFSLRLEWYPFLLLGVLGFFYLVTQTRGFMLPPKLTLENLPENFVSSNSTVRITGFSQGAKKVFLNGQELRLENGRFFTDFSLVRGLNNIEIRAENYLGKETRVTRYVLYQPLASD
ncbi:MAG: helix-turn-helix domain-containing protein [Parcubacteria group bacterium]|nr:helix-turn-helix domain-containing protein [Parcubacteria group bacterium]